MRSQRFALSLGVTLLASCGGVTTSDGDGGASSSVSATSSAIGSPCTTDQEAEPAFLGFFVEEVSIQSSPGNPSGAPVCLVNHFRGLPSCPYGQDASGIGPSGAPSCKTVPGAAPVVGDREHSPTVLAQCTDRRAADTVIKSCRCANDSGKTDDGDDYCTCPGGMACTPMITSIGVSTDHLAGSYCVKSGTEFDSSKACPQACDPITRPCL